MKDIEKIATNQQIKAENDAYIENVKQEIHIHSSDFTYRAPIQTPSLTEDFVAFPKKEEIKNNLLSANRTRGILAITTIQGLGGIGKTTLAIVLAHDEEVQNYFSDGILWATLGQEPDKLSLLNSWIQALGDYQSNHTTVQTASNHLRTLLYDKCILLVIDDVWDSIDAKPFLVGGSNCQTIITTRKAYIADDLGAKSYPLNIMTKEQSLELFKSVLKDCWSEDEKEDAFKVAKDVGYLPLALKLAAKRRKRDYSWIQIHAALEEEIAHLSILESPRIFGKGEEGLEASLNLSLKALKSYYEEAYENFVWLGVLPEDIKINERMTSTFWGIDKEKAGEILEGFCGEGLLIQDSQVLFGSEKLKTYRMHDLFHDIARHYLTFSSVTKKEKDLPGLGLKLNEAHASILNRYKLQTQKGLWHTIEDDAYIHSHLTWHLEKAGKIEDIHKLLSEENEYGKNGWYEALESFGQSAVFIEDIIRAWNLAEKESEHQVEKGDKASFVGMEIRYALINTSINSLSANIPVELLVALLETETWTEPKVFIYAQKEPDPYKRAVKLISIYQKINNESIKRDSLEKAIIAASIIQDNFSRAEALSAIFPNLGGQDRDKIVEEAIDIASKIEKKEMRVKALSAIFPNLNGQKKEEVIKRAVDTSLDIKDEYWRAKALLAVVPSLIGEKKEEVLEKALESALKIIDDSARAEVLSAIIPYLNGHKKEEVMGIALGSASQIQNRYSRAIILSVIFPNLAGQKREEIVEGAIDTASKIKNEELRAKALSAIFPNLGGQKREEIVEEAIDTASKIRDEYWKTLALSAIFPNLDGQKREEVIEEAIDTASKIKNEELREKALSFIFTNLEGRKKVEVVKNAIDIASEIKDEYWRAIILSVIFPNLDGQEREEVIEEAIDTASKIKNEESRVKILDHIFFKIDGQKAENNEEDSIGTALEIQNKYPKEKLKSLEINELYSWWRTKIQILSGLTRNDLLVDITSLLSVVYDLGEDKALIETSRAIKDVSRWWP